MLLEIKTTPIAYELNSKPARLELENHLLPRAKVETKAPRVKMESKSGEMRLDTYEARRSLGYESVGEIIRKRAEHAKETLYQGIRDTVLEGQQMSQIQTGTTIAEIAANQLIEVRDIQTVFLPTGGVRMEWIPAELNITVEPGDLSYDWGEESLEIHYVPGEATLTVTQYPRVDVTYLGKPKYVPPSSAPE